MAGTTGPSQPVPKPVQLFVTRLSTTMKSQRLYPAGSEIPRRNATDTLEALRDAMGDAAHLELTVGREGLAYDGRLVFPRSDSYISFAREFYRRNLAAMRFHAGVTADEINQFLSLMIQPPEQVAAEGGIETGLAELGVANIGVSEVATRIVDTRIPDMPDTPTPAEGEAPAEDAAPAAEADEDSIAEILAEAGSDRARDRRMLMRTLRDPRAVAEYLKRERLAAGDVPDFAKRVGELMRKLRSETGEDRRAAIAAVADAIEHLSPEDRGSLYLDHLLDQARFDRELSDLVNELGADEVLERVVESVEGDAQRLPALARAAKELEEMGATASGASIIDMVVAKMRAHGFSEEDVAGVSDTLSVAAIDDAEGFRAQGEDTSAAVLRLIDPTGAGATTADDLVGPLAAEAVRGTTDGDVIEALVAVALVEVRDEQFNAVMDMVEESVAYLIEALEAEVAADVAQAMVAGAADPRQPETHRARMRGMVTTIARPESLAAVTSVLRRYRSDSPEYLACRRLMSVLGDAVTEPLLEVLAHEDDMSARKALIDMISLTARDYIPALGARVTDQRWYVVRNIVQILGRTRSAEALPHLQRALRHSDPRVRRETIRALTAIRSAVSDEMLAAALQDDNAPNVELAARTLGTLRAVTAVPALEAVARGEGRGSRDDSARIEAMHALVTVGTPEAIAVVRDLAKPRGLFASARERAIRQAAEEALTSPRSDADVREVGL